MHHAFLLGQVIRNYHGHLSGVYSLAQHPTVDILMTGGRDAGQLALRASCLR